MNKLATIEAQLRVHRHWMALQGGTRKGYIAHYWDRWGDSTFVAETCYANDKRRLDELEKHFHTLVRERK